MKKKIVVAIMALVVTMIVCNTQVYAEDVTPTPTSTPSRVNSLIPKTNGSGGRISVGTIFDYYNNILTNNQKMIADYLMGMYNYMYMGARGFIYNNVDTTSQLVGKLRAFGNRFWNTTLDGSASRLDSYMQQYMSAIISYAGTIDSDFSTWIEYISDPEGESLYIPYTKDSLNSWTNYYNDPTAIGVEDWGKFDENWNSGSYFDFEMTGLPWNTASDQQRYNDFVLNNSPYIYSNICTVDGNRAQFLLNLGSNVPDSIFILRSNTNVYQNYRYGYSDISYIQDNTTVTNCYVYQYNNKLMCVSASSAPKWRNGIISSYNGTLSDLINYAFNYTPIRFFHSNREIANYGFYPFITHVYLVDNLTTLSNPQEIFNTTDLGVNGNNSVWIIEPDDEDLYWQIEPTLVTPDMWDELVHEDETPATSDDVKPGIVNNTVINNYNIVAPGTVINVPENWLQGEGNYLEYTNNTAFPFFIMVGDIFNALGEIRIFLIAVLILGLAAGVVVKFLL